jgi:4-hydroxymandelate oxidase
MNPLNVFEYEQLARERLEPANWDFFRGGSDDEITVHENRQAFQRIKLLPRVLRDVSTVRMETTVQGTVIPVPFFIAPTAFQCLAHPDGECATAQAARNSRTVMVVSSFATRSLEEVACSHQSGASPIGANLEDRCMQGTEGEANSPLRHGIVPVDTTCRSGELASPVYPPVCPTHDDAVVSLWLQLYVYGDLGLTRTLVQRAEAAGYRALVLTVDVPRLGRRERDIRNAFKLPPTLRVANFDETHVERDYIPEPAAVTWESVAWLRSITALPIILKGILAPSDALLALEHGVDGIVVSNHGGRQLDSAIASIDALYPVAQAVAGRCEIYLDSGIRRGTDILKALALGARAVLIGRPVIWGLAVNGVAGVQHVLELLSNELALAMALAGCSDVEAVDRSLVVM